LLLGPASHAPLQADWALGTGQAIGAHTGADGQCADAVEAAVGADGATRIHTGTGSGGLWRAKGGVGAAYTTPIAEWLVTNRPDNSTGPSVASQLITIRYI